MRDLRHARRGTRTSALTLNGKNFVLCVQGGLDQCEILAAEIQRMRIVQHYFWSLMSALYMGIESVYARRITSDLLKKSYAFTV